MCPPEQILLRQNQRHQHHRNISENTLLDSNTNAAAGKNDTTDGLAQEPPVVVVAPTTTTTTTTEVLTSAPPPWHAVALIGIVTALMVQNLPSWEDIDQVATISTFVRAEPWIGSSSTSGTSSDGNSSAIWTLGVCRLSIALAIWATTLHVLMGPGWTVVTHWKPGSRLKPHATIRLVGIKTMFPFTSWSWNLLGFSYTTNATIALCVATGRDDWIVQRSHNWFLRSALIVWEIAAPCAILVSTVIRYAIWEKVLREQQAQQQATIMDDNGVVASASGPASGRAAVASTANLKSFRNIMMHNANSVFVLLEMGLLGGLPLRFSELSLAPLFGVGYVLFSWSMTNRWCNNNANDPREEQFGPQFIYYFFDTTMGKVTTLSLLALVCALLLFYVLLAVARIGLDQLRSTAFLVPSSESESPERFLISEDYRNNNNTTEPHTNALSYSPLLMASHVGFVTFISSAVCRFRD